MTAIKVKIEPETDEARARVERLHEIYGGDGFEWDFKQWPFAEVPEPVLSGCRVLVEEGEGSGKAIPFWVASFIAIPERGEEVLEACLSYALDGDVRVRRFVEAVGRVEELATTCLVTSQIGLKLVQGVALFLGMPQSRMETATKELFPNEDGLKAKLGKNEHVGVWLAERMKVLYKNLHAIYPDNGDDQIVAWRNWNDELGWIDIPRYVITGAVTRQLFEIVKRRQSLRTTVSDALYGLGVKVDRSLASDWNQNTRYLTFEGSSRGVDLKTCEPCSVPQMAMISKRVPVGSLGPWSGSQWDRCLDVWFPGKGVKRTVLMTLGQALIGNPAQRFLFLQGIGGTGKSVFIHAILSSLGDLAGTLPVDYIATNKRAFNLHPTGLQVLEGKRVVISGEVPSGYATWNEDLVKNISGGDTIPVRGMRQDFRDVRARTLLVVYGNHRPALRDTQKSMRRRLLLIPFSREIPKEAFIDYHRLIALLEGEKEAILSSLIWGLSEFYASGRTLEVAEEIEEESSAYLDEEDTFGDALASVAKEAAEGRIVIKDLLARIKKKLVFSDHASRMTPRSLVRQLRERGLNVQRGTGNKSTLFGWELLEEEE